MNVDGDLYSRQGTSFNIRMIFINGRKPAPDGYPPLKDTDDMVVKDFDTLYQRVTAIIPDDSDDNRIRIIKAKAIAKLKILELLKISA